MLSQARFHAAIPAQDLARAREFYEQVLGLAPASIAPSGVFYDGLDGSRFLVFPSSGRPSGAHTQLGFLVDDVLAVVRALKQRGVTFESYSMPGFDATTSVATFGGTTSAWFKDTEGNLLGIVQLGAGSDDGV
jgi:catechol 2,3-dioxygenase-like lactoylglutathione lyase family enzyme